MCRLLFHIDICVVCCIAILSFWKVRSDRCSIIFVDFITLTVHMHWHHTHTDLMLCLRLINLFIKTLHKWTDQATNETTKKKNCVNDWMCVARFERSSDETQCKRIRRMIPMVKPKTKPTVLCGPYSSVSSMRTQEVRNRYTNQEKNDSWSKVSYVNYFIDFNVCVCVSSLYAHVQYEPSLFPCVLFIYHLTRVLDLRLTCARSNLLLVFFFSRV